MGKGALLVHPYLNAGDPGSKTDAHPRVQIPAVLGGVIENLPPDHAPHRPGAKQIGESKQHPLEASRL